MGQSLNIPVDNSTSFIRLLTMHCLRIGSSAEFFAKNSIFKLMRRFSLALRFYYETCNNITPIQSSDDDDQPTKH